MHKITIADEEKYADAMEVLIGVGGMFHCIPAKSESERILLINDEQYEALVKNNVIVADDSIWDSIKQRLKYRRHLLQNGLTPMHQISIRGNKKYGKAMELLMHLGGSFTRIQSKSTNERVIIVNNVQYEALIEHKVISRD